MYCTVLYCIVLYCIVLYCIVLYCIVLHLYIYIALLAVHTNQKRFECERPREKRAVWRERKEALGSPVNKVDRVEGRNSLHFFLQICHVTADFKCSRHAHFHLQNRSICQGYLIFGKLASINFAYATERLFLCIIGVRSGAET